MHSPDYILSIGKLTVIKALNLAQYILTFVNQNYESGIPYLIAITHIERFEIRFSVTPMSQQTLPMLKLLIAKFPTFKNKALFAPSTHGELQSLMGK
jgi:hypothetical protein